jgi:signal transduction histidine kinase
VTNSGPDIPQEAETHLFERFYRGDAARTRSAGAADGAGPGLATSRWVARLYGGEVSLIESTTSVLSFESTYRTETSPNLSRALVHRFIFRSCVVLYCCP